MYLNPYYKNMYLHPEIRYDDWVWQENPHIPKGSKVFVGSTIELFGDWVKPEWLRCIFEYCEAVPSSTFIFLTKKPQNLIKWSPFPDNCWVGVSVTNRYQAHMAQQYLPNIEAKVKFVSFEPLLDDVTQALMFSALIMRCQWVIIGQQTPVSKKTQPKIEWIQPILIAAHNAGNIPVFMKNNLEPLITKEWPGWNLRQEFPERRQ
jgi:protein gp37